MFKRCGESIPPVALNLFKNTVGLVLLAGTLVALGDGPATLRQFEARDSYILLLSGFLGIAVADTLFFHGLNRIGLGLSAIVDCLYAPFVMLFSWLLLSEALTATRYVGAALILAGVFISSKQPRVEGRTQRQLTVGMLYVVAALATMSFGIVMAKPVLEVLDFPLIWGTTLRLAAGTVGIGALALASPRRRDFLAAFVPSRMWRYSVPGSVLGTYVCLILWVGGFKWTHASVAAVLNQTSTVFAIILATVLLREPFTRRKMAAVLLAMSGVLLITLHDRLPALGRVVREAVAAGA